MQSFELTQPVSSAILLKQFESRFGQTMNLQGLDKTQLEDLANSVRTKIHTITDNLHFGKELKDNEYQKSQMMLDILNQAINEYGGGMASSIIGKATGEIKDKLSKGQAEGMLELADRIRDEMGADKADAFLQKIQPAIEQAESTLTQTRQDLDQGVRILTGEETATDTIGADTMNTDADLDSLESPEEDDEFGATDAEAGGTEPEGREQRESKEVFEQSNRIYAKLAGK